MLNLGGANIQSGTMVFDYAGVSRPGGDDSRFAQASCDGGRWDVGQLQDSTAAATGLTLGCWTTGRRTGEGDGHVCGGFQPGRGGGRQGQGHLVCERVTGTTWQQGDANYDGVVNGLDRDLWLANVGLPQLSGGASSVTPAPEPTTLALLSVAAIALLARTYRKRR